MSPSPIFWTTLPRPLRILPITTIHNPVYLTRLQLIQLTLIATLSKMHIMQMLLPPSLGTLHLLTKITSPPTRIRIHTPNPQPTMTRMLRLLRLPPLPPLPTSAVRHRMPLVMLALLLAQSLATLGASLVQAQLKCFKQT